MTAGFGEREFHDRGGDEIDAFVTDRYLESLLTAHARGVDRGPTAADPDAAIRRTADRLARDLTRLHPSFRFEEALAARLVDVALRMRRAGGTDAASFVVPLPGDEPWTDRFDADDRDRRRAVARRPVLIGGALTSLALSVAGAVYVAWRRNRTPTSPMVRAARAVARTRVA
ncbi:MAG: hypothetical protein H0T59_00410 [Chloroflexi bacterium]|nr:hypothetical protein [Chloroflexota bacterium]